MKSAVEEKHENKNENKNENREENKTVEVNDVRTADKDISGEKIPYIGLPDIAGKLN